MSIAEPSRFSLSRFVYLALVRTYPRPFRVRFARDMERDFLRTLELSSARRPIVGRVQGWIIVTLDLLSSVPAEHLRARRRRRMGLSPAPRDPITKRSGISMFDRLWTDLRVSARSLLRTPGFTVVAVLTLAIGIGANTAIFSVVNAVLLRPLPYANPDQLVLLTHRMENGSVTGATLSGPDFLDYEEQADLFDGFVAAFATNTNITGDQGADGVVLSWVTSNFFPLLGISLPVGRAFDADDRVLIDPRVFNDPTVVPPSLPAVISHGLWQRRFGGDPDMLGRTIRVNGQTMEVLGVAPRDFKLYLPISTTMPTDVDVWTIWPFQLRTMQRVPSWLVTAIGRLKPDVTLEQAQDQVDGVAAQLREQFASHQTAGVSAELAPIHGQVVAHVRPALLILMGTVGFVLLIACANVANLMLVRATAREREMAIRAAIGAGRGAILRQVLSESMLLGIAGAAGGIALAWVGVDLLVALRPEGLPLIDQVAIDPPVMVFTIGLSIVASLLFGLAPLAHSSNANLSLVLHERSSTGGARRQRLRSALIAFEVAASVVLLIGAGLLLRSFALLSDVRPGFSSDKVLTFQLTLPVFSYRTPEARTDFLQETVDRLQAVPGVEAVGGVYPLPLADEARPTMVSYGSQAGDFGTGGQSETNRRTVLPGFFEAMGIRLVSGRLFERRDNQVDSEPTVVVDRRLAAKTWPGEEAVGRALYLSQRIQLGDTESTPFRVIGVVEQVRFEDLSLDGRDAIYVPHRFGSSDLMNVTVKTAGDPTALIPQVRALIRELDPNLPVLDIRPMEEYVSDSLAPTRLTLLSLGVFAVFALMLALVGLYGVISYTVRLRQREIGVRLALGASQGRVVREILGHGLALTAVGAGIGIGAAILMNRLLAGLLYEVTGTDPLTYVGIVGLLVAVATAACWIPARRAASVHPAVVMRSE